MSCSKEKIRLEHVVFAYRCGEPARQVKIYLLLHAGTSDAAYDKEV